MAYNPAIPQAADLISVSQPQLLANFQQLNVVYAGDHYTFDDATANAQRHRQVRLPELGAAPAAAADMGSVYTADNGGGRTELYYRYDNGALGASRILPLSCIKAFAQFTNVAVPVVASAYNVASVTRALPAADHARFTITFATALTAAAPGTPTDYVVLVSPQATNIIPNFFCQYTTTTNTTFLIDVRNQGPLLGMSFAVIRLA